MYLPASPLVCKDHQVYEASSEILDGKTVFLSCFGRFLTKDLQMQRSSVLISIKHEESLVSLNERLVMLKSLCEGRARMLPTVIDPLYFF